MKRASRLIHHWGAFCPNTGAVSPPIHQVSTFKQDSIDSNKGYDYSRSGNPTRDVLENFIADLEGGKFGYAYSSGMAAISNCLMLLNPGDHIIATDGLYGGTYRVMRQVFEHKDISCSFVDTADLSALRGAFKSNTKAVFLETPCNPSMRISDISAVADAAHEHDSLLMIDNTFMSPWLQRPLEHGADVVIHSATKFLGGHSDLIAGLVIIGDEKLAKRVKMLQNALGAVPSPFDCWLLIRGMKTLGVRMDRGQESAGRIARWLMKRDEVESVLYPGLPDFEGHDIHDKQADGAGAVLSFRLKKGYDGRKLVEAAKMWTLAVSLGGVESIITLPARMTHLPYAPSERERLSIDDRLVRLSVGVEDCDDLIEDLENALKVSM